MNQQGWIVAVLFMLSAGFVKAENSPRLSTWNDKNLAAWWQANPDPATWNSAAADLKLALLNAQERYDLEKVFENDHFRGWLVHTRWLELFDVESASDGELQAFRALSLKMEIPRLFVSSLDARDDAEKALKNLIGIAVGNPESIFHYPELAVAFSVVFDQPFPEAWPHPFTKQNWLMLGNPDPAERFGFMISSIEKKQLLLDPSDLSVRELTFAVDSPVDLNEFIYAQQVKLASPASLAALYPAVKYDFPRAQKGNFMWPHGENYHLFEIGKRGGICADQAFFVSQTAKSKGVPALFFLGQGRSGGHAGGISFETGQVGIGCGEISRRKISGRGGLRSPNVASNHGFSVSVFDQGTGDNGALRINAADSAMGGYESRRAVLSRTASSCAKVYAALFFNMGAGG